MRADAFQVITFFDPKLERQIILLYCLGEDGKVYECNGVNWTIYEAGEPIQRPPPPPDMEKPPGRILQ